MKIITQLYGQWGTNIGNAFFNIGGTYILKSAYPDFKITHVSDVSRHLLPWNKQLSGVEIKNDAFIQQYLETDYIVLQGPIFSKQIHYLYDDLLSRLESNGTKIIMLSVGMNSYDTVEVTAGKHFLEKHPPHILVTRDALTFNNFHEFAENSHNGIDSAFFVPLSYIPIKLLKKYICMACDQTLEPQLVESEKVKNKSDNESEIGFCISGKHLQLIKRDSLRSKLRDSSSIGKLISYLLRKKSPQTVADIPLIRTFHKVNPFRPWWIYQAPNTHASDEPYSYFNIYSNSLLTITDRVHAAVITLAYGNPVIFLGKTERSHLFDDICPDVNSGQLCSLSENILSSRRDDEISFLKNISI